MPYTESRVLLLREPHKFRSLRSNNNKKIERSNGMRLEGYSREKMYSISNTRPFVITSYYTNISNKALAN